MRKKVLIVLALIYGVHFFASCCENKTYEWTITGVESRVLVIDGNSLSDYDFISSIDRDNLVLELSFSGTEERIAAIFRGEFNKLGFNSAYASIDCEDQTIKIKNRIVSLSVSILDANNNNERIDITGQVRVYGTQQSLPEYISDVPDLSLYDELLIQIDNSNNIPDRIEYDIEATLDDGLVVSSSGGIINFN